MLAGSVWCAGVVWEAPGRVQLGQFGVKHPTRPAQRAASVVKSEPVPAAAAQHPVASRRHESAASDDGPAAQVKGTHRRRVHGPRGARAPTYSFTNGWARGGAP